MIDLFLVKSCQIICILSTVKSWVKPNQVTCVMGLVKHLKASHIPMHLPRGCTLLLMGGLSLSKPLVNFMTLLKVLLATWSDLSMLGVAAAVWCSICMLRRCLLCWCKLGQLCCWPMNSVSLLPQVVFMVICGFAGASPLGWPLWSTPHMQFQNGDVGSNQFTDLNPTAVILLEVLRENIVESGEVFAPGGMCLGIWLYTAIISTASLCLKKIEGSNSLCTVVCWCWLTILEFRSLNCMDSRRTWNKQLRSKY